MPWRPYWLGVLSVVTPTQRPVAMTASQSSTSWISSISGRLLSSVVPFLADLLALRRVPAHRFGIVMSLSPVFAAAIGAAFLGEALAALDWLAIGMIVGANAVLVAPAPAEKPVTT